VTVPIMIRFAAMLGVALALAASPARAQGQPLTTPPPAAQAPQVPDLAAGRPIGAGELQKLFEAYTVLQAQDALQLSETQYGRFVTRLKLLQDTRRRHQQTRNQMLADLRRLTNPQAGTSDESVISERLKAFREEDDRSAGDIRKAYEAVDETLDTRQQARFRLFEERMEQQKLELLMRARQNARAQAQRRGR
jgi:hypothetical protein